jgi:hypothetical protein
MFGIVYKSEDTFNYIEVHHHYWRSNERIWRGASPFVQSAQHKGTAIVLFNVPTQDPWFDRGPYLKYRDKFFDNLIQEGLVRYPKSIDQKVEANGWIFLREQDVYVAIRPLKAYAIDGDYHAQMTKYASGTSDAYMNYFVDAVAQFDVIRSASPQTGFVFDVATKDDFATFDEFQAAVSSKQVTVDWNSLSVTYTSLKGDTLTSTWNTPNYNVPNGTRVWVRPIFSVNGTTIANDNDFITGKAVIKSPPVELVNRVLRLKTPGGNLMVDWTAQDPTF